MREQKIKSRLIKDGLYKNNCIKNYFEAAWIANLGVVPLFLFAAFLLAPAFFFFLNLLFVVTHVLETIRQLPYSNRILNFNFESSFLPSKSLCVKGIFLSICTMNLLALNSFANEISQDVIMSRGQTKSLIFPHLEHFSISNKQIISHKFNEKNKNLLLKAQQLGHAQITIWDKNNKEEIIDVYVISKREEAKLIELSAWANVLGLKSQIIIPQIRIYGQVNQIKQFQDYKKYQNLHRDLIIDDVQINTEIKNKIIAEIYKTFLDNYNDSIRCEEKNSSIVCTLSQSQNGSDGIKKHFTDLYGVIWIDYNEQRQSKNYLLKLKLIQIEQMSGEEIRLGLEQLNTNLSELLTTPLQKIVQKNEVMLSKQNVKLSTLAEPQTIIRPLSPAIIQIGADIPFSVSTSQKNHTVEWKFAGLKVEFVLENLNDELKINYQAELTQPTENASGSTSISGNKEKSSAVIALNHPVKIFEIFLKTNGQSTNQLPYLGRIPILGKLFQSSGEQSNYKSINGIIEVIEDAK
jgi:Flp pilus assembly secretin CpaC